MIILSILLFFCGLMFWFQGVSTSYGVSPTILILSAGFFTGGFLIVWNMFFGVPVADFEIMLLIVGALFSFIVANFIAFIIFYWKREETAK